MRPILIMLAFVCIGTFSSCKDDSSEDPCELDDVSSFYALSRNVILSESFDNNNNEWTLTQTQWLSPDLCDTTAEPTISQGELSMVTLCDRDTATATLDIPAISGRYLAAEVKFNQFIIRMSCPPNTYENAYFIIDYGNKRAAIGLRKLYSCFKMDMSGHTVHFLLDLEDEAAYAFTDEFIEHYDGDPIYSEGTAGIYNTDISSIFPMNNKQEAASQAIFGVTTGFEDVAGPVYASMRVESIELYEPVLEGCN